MQINDYITFAQNILGVEFSDISLLQKAFTHRSYLNEHKKSTSEHNERLEFLGDAVLELIVTEYLYLNFQESEGILTNWRSSLVRTESIGALAKKLGYENYLRLSKGEKRGSERARDQILANCFEAVIGALYLDQGYQATKDFLYKNLIVTFQEILSTGSWIDPKSKLQEVVQAQELSTPFYKVISEDGPDHDKTFEIAVFIDNQKIGEGSGPSKQLAQQQAAMDALKNKYHQKGYNI